MPARSAGNDERASRFKSEAVTLVSHEFRTPMNAVLGMIDLLRLTDLTQKQRDYLHVIESSGNMLLSLVNNILDYSALGSGPLTLQSDEFGVVEIIDRVVDVTGYQISSKGLEFAGIIDCDQRLRVQGDLNRICQILVNLVSNAVKFSTSGDVQLRIGAEVSGDLTWLRFVVEDHGIGMTESVKQMLFHPFARPAAGEAHREPGSGLGLAISKQLIEYMGGDILISSVPGRGTKVRFSVPVETAEPGQASTALAGRRILFVSRSSTVAASARGYCEAWGAECDFIDSFDAALPQILDRVGHPRGYDLVAADASDVRRSIAFARQVRAEPGLAALPILLLTPISTPLEPGVVSSLGDVVCVNKPVSPEHLEDALLSLFDRSDEAGEVVAATPPDQGRLRILIAEDNPMSLQLLTDMLRSLGYVSDGVRDGHAAMVAAERNRYDLILLDGQMPDLDGPDVARAIRKRTRPGERSPLIIAVTADASASHRQACLDAGMDDFLAKPLRLAKLSNVLRRWRATVLEQPAGEGADTAEPDALADKADKHALARLRDLSGSADEAFLQPCVELFLTDTQERMNALAIAAEGRDFRAVSRNAHALKGACLELGVLRMAGLCDALRRTAEATDAEQVYDTLRRLRLEFERVSVLLAKEAAARLRSPV